MTGAMYMAGEARKAALEALALVLAVMPEEERRGGYLTVEARYDITLLRPNLIGEVADGKDARCAELCVEKVARLFSHLDEGHRSSWESRDPENGKWGGAVPGSDGNHVMGVGFSGLPELADEAISLIVCVKVGYLTLEQAIEIAQISSNSVFLGLVDKLVAPPTTDWEECPTCEELGINLTNVMRALAEKAGIPAEGVKEDVLFEHTEATGEPLSEFTTCTKCKTPTKVTFTPGGNLQMSPN